MIELVSKTSASVLIGVCGEQAAGKTVFLTCVFQSIAASLPEEFIVNFDRKDVGNANYFQAIEDSLLERGQITGTTERDLYPARIFVKLYERLPRIDRATLTVDLLDFAGRHFRSMADLKHLLGEEDAEERKALLEVNEALERADGFIILINTTEIDPDVETPRRNPFSPSVNYLLAHCRDQRKPVALLFSQADRTPALTEKLFRELPRVQDFDKKFTSNREESWRPEGRPFGLARRISCYEEAADGLPRRQSLDGSIWRPEPSEVVIELLRAAMPQIRERLENSAAAITEKEDQDLEAERKRRQRSLWLRSAVVLAVLIVLALLVFAYFRREESGQVRFLGSAATILREGPLVGMNANEEERLGQFLAAHRANPEKTAEAVRAAVRDLESALGEAAQRLGDQPALDAAYGEELARFQGLVTRFDPASTDAWRKKLLPVLAARSSLLSDWFGTERKERRPRTRFLDGAAKRFLGAADHPFASLLTAQSTKEKEAEVDGWQARIDADADVATRFATIQSLLASAVAEQDPEFSRLARKALAGQVITTILKRHENGFLRDKLLTPLAPNLANLGDGEVRFEVLASTLLSCTDEQDCRNRQGIVQSAITEADTTAASWSSGVDNLLRSLLLDLPPEERPEIWRAMAGALSSAYLFSSREDAWPSGLLPLASTVLSAANAETDTTENLIERITKHPIYEGELLYLGDRLTAMATRRQVVPLYSVLLSTLEEGEDLLQTGGLTTVGQQVSSALANRPMPKGPLAEIGREIGQVLALAQSVNSQRARGSFGDPSAAMRLALFLKGAGHSHCSALEPHGAPTECANAGARFDT